MPVTPVSVGMTGFVTGIFHGISATSSTGTDNWRQRDPNYSCIAWMLIRQLR